MATHEVQTNAAPKTVAVDVTAAIRHGLAALLPGLMVAMLAGCGGGGGGVPTASADIGPAGGTLTGPDGVQVVVR